MQLDNSGPLRNKCNYDIQRKHNEGLKPKASLQLKNTVSTVKCRAVEMFSPESKE